MTARLRDVIVAQHRRLLTIIDHAESSLDDAALIEVRRIVLCHLAAEEDLVYSLVAPHDHGSAYGAEQHHVLRFMLDRLGEATTRMERATRLRVLRDLFVHHVEREEWVTLELIERGLEPRTSAEIARRVEARFLESKRPARSPPQPDQARRKGR